nr:hypothetical protein CFP56_00369 [Quercus suber]
MVGLFSKSSPSIMTNAWTVPTWISPSKDSGKVCSSVPAAASPQHDIFSFNVSSLYTRDVVWASNGRGGGLRDEFKLP